MEMILVLTSWGPNLNAVKGFLFVFCFRFSFCYNDEQEEVAEIKVAGTRVHVLFVNPPLPRVRH